MIRHGESLGGLTALGLTLAVAAGSLTASGHNEDGAPGYQQVAIEQCAPPSPQSIEAVEQLFSPRPVLPLDAATHDKGENKMMSMDELHTRDAAIAASYGLTLPDRAPLTRLEKTNVQRDSFDYFFTNARDYLGEFGVSLEVAKPDEFDLKDDQIPTMADLDTPDTKYQIRELAAGFAELPVEYFALAGIKHAVIAKNTGENVSAYAMVAGLHDTIVLNAGKPARDTELATHEVTHLLDAKECGSSAMFHDPAYEALGGKSGIYTEATRGGEITYRGKLRTPISIAIDDQAIADRKKACQDQAIVDDTAAKVVAYSDYGLTNVVEDKAEVGKNFAFPSQYSHVLDRSMPKLRAKFQFLMARLYELNPNIVKYAAAVGNHTPAESMNSIIKDC